MKFSELAPRERHNFVYFLLFFFFYYFIMSAYFPFFPVWLADVNHLTKTETGIVFSSISLFAIIFQPVFGLMSDKLGLRKHLLWTITVLLILFAPFFIFVFSPLLQMNIIAGSLVGGIYLGIVFSSGSGAVEAYIERVSRANRFEYGKVRVAGCVGWAPIARPFRCVRRQSCCVCRASGALSSMWWVSPASTTCLTSSSPTFSKAFSPVRSAVPKCLASSPPAASCSTR
ncbi:oligosaccharide:H+ symporter [Klebsiella pneumoniae subsp. rhinoscleromatis ATCC 13884]|nr:oligosaccharide:H+ symporter [Klebsiella pneumoniae subsp. rhinoscleromatis ATCC 13884]